MSQGKDVYVLGDVNMVMREGEKDRTCNTKGNTTRCSITLYDVRGVDVSQIS